MHYIINSLLHTPRERPFGDLDLTDHRHLFPCVRWAEHTMQINDFFRGLGDFSQCAATPVVIRPLRN